MAENLQYLYVGLLCLTGYSMSITGKFVFDDGEAIVKNKDVLPTSSMYDIFKNDFWGTPINSNASHKSYRPLTILSYKFNIIFTSSLDPISFRLTNVILYAVLSVLAIPLYKTILKSQRRYYRSDDIPFLSAILFSVHPVHVEAVAGLVGRADLLSSILSVIAIIIYDKALRSKSIKLTLFSVALIVTGTLFKETAIMALPLCWIFDLFSFIQHNNYKYKNIQPILKRSMVLLVSGIIIIYFRLAIMNFQGPIFTANDNPAAHADTLFAKIVTYNYIYLLNLLILIWPQWLCFDWSMGCVPLIRSFEDNRTLIVILFWILLSYIIFTFLNDLCRQRNKLCVVLGCLFLVVPFIPAMNILVQVGFVIAERNLLLPSIGYCYLVVIGFKKIEGMYSSYKRCIRNVYYITCLILLLRTIQRSLEWKSEESLFASALEVCPLNAKVHYNIAKIAVDQNNKPLAMREYKLALVLNPSYEQAMNNLANLLRDENRYLEAEKYLREAVRIRPNFAAAWMNLAIVLSNINSTEEAERCYYEAISHRPRYPDCYYNLGNLYLDQGKYEDALVAWRRAVYYRPTHVAAWSNILVLLDSQLRYKDVLDFGNIALTNNPSSAAIHFNIANTLGKLQDFKKAELHFLEAINLNRNNPMYYSNLGVLYHHWNKTKEAIDMYRKSIQLDPNLRSAKSNLQKLLRSKEAT